MKKIKINVNNDRIVNELIELIKICSPSGNEEEISKTLKSKFSRLGLEVIEDESQEVTKYGSGNLICNLPGDPSVTPILFIAHMDTVLVDKPIQPYIKNNYLMTDGSTILGADNKVGIAIMLEVVKLLKQYNIKHGPLQFVLTVGEEAGLIGAKAINRSLLHAAYGYALDHTGKIGQIVTKGVHHVNLLISIKVPLHEMMKISAIKMATKTIKRIRIGKVDKGTTVHIVNFDGQKGHDQLYDCVKIKIEIKSLDKIDLTKEIDLITATVRSLAEEYNIEGHVKIDSLCEGFAFNETDQVVKTAKNAANKVNLSSQSIKTSHCSDANVLTDYGIPTANLAVGYENIHTHSERYNLSYLERLVCYVISIIKEV